MRRSIDFLAVSVGLLVMGLGGVCAGKEPFVEFLQGLMRRGYGEQALTYLDQIAGHPELPLELKATLDLERSRALRAAAGEASDQQQRAARLAESKRLAEKFFAEHPTHPAAGSLLLVEGDELLATGEQRLELARHAASPEVRVKANLEARVALVAARGRYDVAVERLKERIEAARAQIPEGTPLTAKQAELQEELALPWVEARSKRALCDYLAAVSYGDAKDPDRDELLRQAEKGFDGVYQEYRDRQAGLLAHLWCGKTLEELGEVVKAMDVYEEVLGSAPELDEDPGLAPLFGQAELFWLQLKAKTSEPSVIVTEGEGWLAKHKTWQATPQYVGIALEVARGKLRVADKLKGADRTKLIRDTSNSLLAISKAETEHRHEALLLRREAIAKMGSGSALSQQETLALAEESAADRNWTEAEALYRQALELARKANDARTQEAVKPRLAQVIYRQAVDQYGVGEMAKALDLCGMLVRDYPSSPLAEEASALAVAAALAEYGNATETTKAAALERLKKVTDYGLKQWPAKAVADDARMAMAQVSLGQSDFPTALAWLSQVNPQSKRYAGALTVIGQVKWQEYSKAKRGADASEREAEIARLREEAVGTLQTSLARQRASWQTASEPMPATMFDTQLLLGEVYLEGQQWSEAAPLFEALVELMKRAKPTTLDRSGQRALVGGVRAWLPTGKVGQAAEATLMLVDLSGDEEQANGVLVELAKLIGQEARKSTPMKTTEQTTFAAAPQSDPLRDLQGRVLDALVPRMALSVPQLIYIGDACMGLERSDKAREVFERLLKMIEKDETAKAKAGAAAMGIRARLVGLLRSEGKLEEASQQVEALIKDRPNALGPLMEKGYILQSLAERNPQKYDECVEYWTTLRQRLGQSKTRGAEYYEVLYNAATCLVRQARQTSDKVKAQQAEQMLKATLVQAPKLSGPEMVAKYEALLGQAAALKK